MAKCVCAQVIPVAGRSPVAPGRGRSRVTQQVRAKLFQCLDAPADQGSSIGFQQENPPFKAMVYPNLFFPHEMEGPPVPLVPCKEVAEVSE